MKKQLNTQIDIQAPAKKVWDILMDFKSYGDWNPFIRKISGKIEPDSKLNLSLQLEGRDPMNISPKLVICEQNRHFAWKGKLLFTGLFDGEHHFEVVPVNDSSCRFVHYENFSGVLIPFVKKMLDQSTRRAFENMNLKLKQKAEYKE